jgi:hypothetical protein
LICRKRALRVYSRTSNPGAMWPLNRLIARENGKHYRQILAEITDEAERQRILKLLADEEKKQREAEGKIEE